MVDKGEALGILKATERRIAGMGRGGKGKQRPDFSVVPSSCLGKASRHRNPLHSCTTHACPIC
jgi:hypothetical protein